MIEAHESFQESMFNMLDCMEETGHFFELSEV
jgi:hypothetical protein